MQDSFGILATIVFADVRGVAFLPKEFARSQKDARAKFPANNVCPLVQQQRKIAVALHPLGHELADDRFRCRTNYDWLFKFLATSNSDDCEFGAEPFNMLSFTLEVTLRDEQREIGVLGPGALDAAIDLGLHLFPDRIAVGTDDHRAAHRTVIGQFRLGNDVLVPAREIFGLRGENRSLSHGGRC